MTENPLDGLTHAALPMGGTLNDVDAWEALDAVAFDASLSFLAEADAKPVPSQGLLGSPSSTSPTLLERVQGDDDDVVATALANDVRALATEEDPECEPTESSSTAGSDSSSTTPCQHPPKPAYASSRVRQKQEIAYLRAQVVELERELAAKTHSAAAGSEAPSAWKHIAQRQLGEKMRAERENATLCSLLEGQLRVARSLERLLRKRVLSETDDLLIDRKRQRSVATTLELEMAVNEIRARIAFQLGTVHAVMDECGLSGITTDYDDARATSTTAANGICMELMTVKVYPFALADVVNAVWACACAGGDDATADLEFTVPLHMRRSQAQVHIRGVCERRVDADEALIVFENVGIVEGPLVAGRVINCRELGYMLVEPGVPSGEAPTTVLKACARMWPEADAGERAPEVGLFVDLVLGFYNQHTQAILQTVENRLLSSNSAAA